MKVVKHEVVVELSPEVVWRTWMKNFQVTLPRLVPQHYLSVEYLDGPPLAPGGVVLVQYNPASFPHFDYIKGVWDEIDHENHYFKARILEGGHLGKHENATLIYTMKLEPGPKPNTCLKKWTFEFDEVQEDEFHDFIKEEMSIFGSALQEHLLSK